MKPTATEVMMQIEALLSPTRKPYVLEGWCDVEKAQALAAIVIGLRPKVSVEIGVFGGRSLIPLGLAHSLVGGYVIGIDPWSKAASLEGMDGDNKEWWDALDHEAIYQSFIRAANRQIAEGFIQVARNTSDKAIDAIPEVIDLLHIDGNHSTQAVKDVDNYATRIRPGGILIMDDVDWATEAAARVRELKFNFLYTLGTGAVLQK